MISSRKQSENRDEKEAPKKKKPKVTPPQRRHYGLENQGATCYLNSVLQVLSITTEIRDRLDPKSQITDQELRNVFEKLEETTCGTEDVAKSLGIENVHQQRDAAECLELILSKVSPRASEVFQGQLTYTTKCSNKGHSINEETNPFWTLPLSLKDSHGSTYSVERGFKSMFQRKSFSGDNMVYCSECKKKTEATSGCQMTEHPRILTLLLKRFDFDYDTMSHVKSDRSVEVPRALQTKAKKYNLYGMVNHMGGLQGGHYTATILFDVDKTWYEFNDAYFDKVEEQPFAKTKTYNSRTAYLLMYRASESRREEEAELDEDEPRRKREFKESDADDKENRHLGQNLESREQMRQEVEKERRDANDEEEVSSFDEVFIKDDAQTENTSYLSEQRTGYWTTAEKRKQRSKREECELIKADENCPQPRRSLLARVMMNPLLIFLIVLGCVIIVIIPVLLTTLS